MSPPHLCAWPWWRKQYFPGSFIVMPTYISDSIPTKLLPRFFHGKTHIYIGFDSNEVASKVLSQQGPTYILDSIPTRLLPMSFHGKTIHIYRIPFQLNCLQGPLSVRTTYLLDSLPSQLLPSSFQHKTHIYIGFYPSSIVSKAQISSITLIA
jgi:hypothetical protein